MKLLSDLPIWAGVTVMLLADAAVVALLMSHEQRQMQKILRTERKRLEEWADQRADQLADERFTQRMIEERIRQNRK